MESQRPWTRREFLKTTVLAAFIPSLPPVSKSYEERYGRNFEEFISAQDPHNRIQLNALYKIPESLIPRSSEAQNIPLHMRPLMDCWRAGSTILDWIGKDVYFAYLAGVNEAVARGQEAVAVLEMPVDWNQDWKDWPQYLGWLVPQVSATDWVIGNEMWDKAVVQGKPPRGRPTGWGNWRYYAQLFAQAYDEIKTVHPDTRIVLTAPHYYGQTEILQHQLDGLDTQNTLRASGGKPAIKLDAISLHYYDKAGNLPDYVGLHKQELKRRGLSIPIILTELGRARGERYSEAGRVFGNTPTELFKRVLMSCALLNEGMLD
ncbi:MAG: hypothetical protein ACE5DQ_00865, partial [Candidatus Paceibacterota bacterium]